MAEEEEASYLIVQIKEENEYLLNRVIVVPVTYVIIDADDTFHVRYAVPPYDDEDLKLIKGIVQKNGLPAPEAWPQFKCSIIRGFGMHLFYIFNSMVIEKYF